MPAILAYNVTCWTVCGNMVKQMYPRVVKAGLYFVPTEATLEEPRISNLHYPPTS